MIVQEVFTPDDYPEYTYVERDRGEHEKNLKFYLKKPRAIISLSGPSKSGKTMLFKNVINDLNYQSVTVHGSDVNSASGLWNNALDELGAPTSREISETSQKQVKAGGEAGVNIPGFSLRSSGSKENQTAHTETKSQGRTGLRQLVTSVDLDEFVLYIDDAHYIDETLHASIAEGIKQAHERGLSTCVAFIPSRSDDLTRSNPDLTGRIESISLDYWDKKELMEIGTKGFGHLNRNPPDLILKNLARESIGSPHLMQKLCLELCNEVGVYEASDEQTNLDIDSLNLENVLRDTAESFRHNYTTVFDLLTGDATKGRNERSVYELKPFDEGDIYDVILRALADNPPKLTLSRDEILSRARNLCKSDPPQSGNVVQTIQRMDRWISEKVPSNAYCFDWACLRVEIQPPQALSASSIFFTAALRTSSRNWAYQVRARNRSP